MRILLFFSTLRRLQSEKRALESRLEALERKLEEESARNRERENFLISQVLTAAGRYGLPKSVDPPRPEAARRPPQAQELTGIQRATIEALKAEGEALGRSPIEIETMIDAVKRGETMPTFEDEVIN